MTDPTMATSKRELFGGAITANLPNGYLDARFVVQYASLKWTALMYSDMRQIPDNQEVFLSSNSETSVIFEILQMVEEGRCSTDLWEAIK
jgi:hypothetical protein